MRVADALVTVALACLCLGTGGAGQPTLVFEAPHYGRWIDNLGGPRPQLTTAGNHVLFAAGGFRWIWASDGTVAGTVELWEVPEPQYIRTPRIAGDFALFPLEWDSGGETEWQLMAYDAASGSFGSIGRPRAGDTQGDDYTVVGDEVVFIDEGLAFAPLAVGSFASEALDGWVRGIASSGQHAIVGMTRGSHNEVWLIRNLAGLDRQCIMIAQHWKNGFDPPPLPLHPEKAFDLGDRLIVTSAYSSYGGTRGWYGVDLATGAMEYLGRDQWGSVNDATVADGCLYFLHRIDGVVGIACTRGDQASTTLVYELPADTEVELLVAMDDHVVFSETVTDPDGQSTVTRLRSLPTSGGPPEDLLPAISGSIELKQEFLELNGTWYGVVRAGTSRLQVVATRGSAADTHFLNLNAGARGKAAGAITWLTFDDALYFNATSGSGPAFVNLFRITPLGGTAASFEQIEVPEVDGPWFWAAEFPTAAENNLFFLATSAGLGSTHLMVIHATIPGDTNCDGVVDMDDIDPFVVALLDEAGYAAGWPGCERRSADVNGDGAVDFFDIDPFVVLLME
jgi:hypothetical protein